MTNRPALIAIRLALGLLALLAIGTQLSIHIQRGFNVVNFFSFFTNLSNLFAAIVLLMGAFQLLAHRRLSAWIDVVRGAAVSQMAVVGIVFAVLLRDVDLGALLPWVNTVLHYVIPVAVVVEWLVAPPHTKLGSKQLFLCQVFPLLYIAYTLIRGATIGWYPYPFLNPGNVGGYGGVALYAIAIAVVCFAVSALLFALANRLRADR
jgi:hypothetical protein